jgi:transcriptional regulator with XRE-family HTH domain
LLREERNFSQTYLEKRTGLLRFHISRIENGHTVPTQETPEKMAAALGVPLYRLFYDADGALGPSPRFPEALAADKTPYGRRLHRLVHKMDDSGRQVLLELVRKLASK